MLKSSKWVVTAGYQKTEAGRTFSTIDKVFSLEGKPITSDALSNVHRVEVDGIGYYVKRYTSAGKGFRRYAGKSRIRAEWENLLLFQKLGVPTVSVVAYGEEKNMGMMTRGALITREAENTMDLKAMVKHNSSYLHDTDWVENVISQVAAATRIIHSNKFIHTDLKWRNILVTQSTTPQMFFIDCPSGSYMSGYLLKRNIIKDIACLDKVAKQALRKTQRLSFYKKYAEINKLSPDHKKNIKRILSFFEGRE